MIPWSDDTLSVPTADTPVIDAALAYVEIGFRPVPVYGVADDGSCKCGDAACRSIGKHPKGDAWQQRAARMPDEVRDAFARHSGNVGIYVGDTPYIVLDFDGEEGLETLAELEAAHMLPRTLRARSGGGGAHLIYQLGSRHVAADISDRRVGPAWDVKKHGQVLAAPSRHASGNRYEWVDPAPIATLTDELYARIRKPVYLVPSPGAMPRGDLAKRARAYVDRMPQAISGAGGHDATFAVARKLVQDFGLPDHEAWAILLEYNQRCEPPWTEKDLRHKLESARKAHTRVPVQDRPRRSAAAANDNVAPPPGGPGDPPPPGAAPDWRSLLLWDTSRTGKDRLVTHHENVIRILQLHPAWKGKIRYDEFRGRVLVTGAPWDEFQRASSVEDDLWTDEDATRLAAWLRREFHGYGGFAPKVTDCERAVDVVARVHGFHPVREYLDGLTWDQVLRLPRMGDYFGAEDAAHVRHVMRWWMISAVARVFEPGCKADHVLILEGKQGIRKSTALEILAGASWFSDTPIDLNSKDAYGQIRGKWIVELAELDSLFKAESSRAKAFFSSKKDDYRAAYARREREQKRSVVFAGSVNEGTYLKDPTGNRRFWPVRCSRIDLEALRRDRDQLWAEAVWAYREGAAWYPDTDEEKATVGEATEEREEQDSWREKIAEYVQRPDRHRVTTGEILEHALGILPKDWTRAAQTRVGAVMVHSLRWAKRRAAASDGSRQWVYERSILT